MTHTPGPWYHREHQEFHDAPMEEHVNDEDGNTIVECGTGLDAQANAHLIAAAPELLEALKATLAYALGQVTDCDLIETTAQARAAIAKAEGKQS